MRHHAIGLTRWALLLAASCLAACTGGVGDHSTHAPVPPVPAYPVTGTVTGLGGAAGLVLQVNGGETVTVAADGSVAFPASIANGEAFNVTVLTQPLAADGTPQVCTVTGGTGTISGAGVSFLISCTKKVTTTDAIGGSVAGLAGSGLTLISSDGTQLAVSGNGPFTIESLPPGTNYAVTVLGQPYNPDQLCSVANGAGVTGTTDVTGIAVNCQTSKAPTYTVGVTVTGLSGTGASITLNDNGRDPLTVAADGSYTFALAVPSGATYSVSAPAGGGSQSFTCSLANATGVVQSANITNVQLACQVNTGGGGTTPPPSYSVSGSITGLTGLGANLTLTDNGGSAQTFTADSSFTFSGLMNGSGYAVGESVSGANSCTIANGSGSIAGADVTNVTVTCQAAPTYTIGGTIEGLPAGLSVTLRNEGGDAFTQGSGAFTFPTALANNAPYDVSVQDTAGSAAYTCTVTNGTGTVAGAAVTNVQVSCALTTYSIGGSVSGLPTGAAVQLTDNGGDPIAGQGNGSFTFPTPLSSGTTYNVAAMVTSGSATCSVTNGTGTVTAAVTNVSVACNATYTISGAVSGLPGGATVQLTNNGGDPITVSGNVAFTFPTAVVGGTAYDVEADVTAGSAICSVTGGSGTVTDANITGVTVTCNAVPPPPPPPPPPMPPYYIPFQASPVPGSTGGQTGLMVVPTNSPTTAPVFVTTSASSFIGLAGQATLSGSGLFTSLTEYASFYLITGADGFAHVYALKLADTTVSAAPTQVGSLSLPSGTQVCSDSRVRQTKITDGSTAFALLHSGGASGCGSTDDGYYVIRYTDSATTPPTTIPVASADANAVYNTDGTLGGLVLWDPTSQNLYFYADLTFTSPKTLATGVTGKSLITDSVGGYFPVSSTTLVVTYASSNAVVRVDPSGTAVQLYTTTGSLGSTAVRDDNNLYFTDLQTSSTAGTVLIVQAPIAGGATTVLYSTPAEDGTSFELLGANDKYLVVSGYDSGISEVASLPVGTTSTALNVIVSGGEASTVSAYLVATPGNIASGVVLVNAQAFDSSASIYQSGVYKPDGTVLQPLQNNSQWISSGVGFLGYALLASGITSTDGSFGGGSVLRYDTVANSVDSTPFTTTGGAAYTFPAGLIGESFDLALSVSAGVAIDASETYSGLIFDVSNRVAVPVALPNTNVLPFD